MNYLHVYLYVNVAQTGNNIKFILHLLNPQWTAQGWQAFLPSPERLSAIILLLSRRLIRIFYPVNPLFFMKFRLVAEIRGNAGMSINYLFRPYLTNKKANLFRAGSLFR